jgi:Fe-S cluster assembly iron-binding protein IscA
VLTLTSDAAEAVKTLAEAAPQMPSDSGLRIHAEQAEEGRVGFGLTLVEGPDEDDYVNKEAGVRVFVAPETALFLEDKILDAAIAGDRVQFSLGEQD